MTEQYILGEMLDIYIEQETDLNVEVTQGVGGGTSNIEPAIEKGEFDLYPEYTGTGWNAGVKEKKHILKVNLMSFKKNIKKRIYNGVECMVLIIHMV